MPRLPVIFSIVVILPLAGSYALKDEAVEFWEDETESHEKLTEAQYKPVFGFNDLSHKSEVGLLLYGDAGTGNKGQHNVAKGMWTLCRRQTCSLAISLGDNIYPEGVTAVNDPLFRSAFEEPYQKFVDSGDINFWMAVGNHDRRSSIDAQIRYTEVSPIWRMPAEDYGIPGLPPWLHIYVLDTTFIAPGADIPPFQSAFQEDFQAQLERASEYLCGKPGWRVLAMHHPVVSNGSGNNRFREDNLYEALGKIIGDCGIQLVFGGHDHIQQHVRMDGVDYLIQGAGSTTRPWASKPLQHDDALSHYLGYAVGFAHLRFTGHSLDIRFNDANGNKLYSYRTSAARKEPTARR